jgi:hypothetical protein
MTTTKTLKNEMLESLDKLEINDLQKNALRNRWLDQFLWMDKHSEQNQRLYYAFRIFAIIGTLLITILVGRANSIPNMQEFVFGLSILVAGCASIESFLRFGENWQNYRQTAEALKTEWWSFFQLSGCYKRFDNYSDAYSSFASRVEEVIQHEVSIHFTSAKGKEEEQKPTSS